MKRLDYTLQRSKSSSTTVITTTTTKISSRKVTPSIIPHHHNHHMHNNNNNNNTDDDINLLILRGSSPSFSFSHHNHHHHHSSKLSSLLRSFLHLFSFPSLLLPSPSSCKWLPLSLPSPSLLTGTLFGRRRGHVSFSIQLDNHSDPLLLLELAISTSSLVKEMSSGLVRIALECEKRPVQTGVRSRRLFLEPSWVMYCNGRKCGYAVSRTCGDYDWHVLSTVQSVSVGAGVIPVLDDGAAVRKGGGSSEGELLYMRAKFERVVGSRDSEAFYMLNPDGNGGPELSIFLLRI